MPGLLADAIAIVRGKGGFYLLGIGKMDRYWLCECLEVPYEYSRVTHEYLRVIHEYSSLRHEYLRVKRERLRFNDE